MEYIDFNKKVGTKEVTGILDGNCFVKLIGFSPNMVPPNHTPEFQIASCARLSFGKSHNQDIQRDIGLIRYLYKNQHTSPFEMCNITYALKVPKAIAIQILRHRTAKFLKVNEFSQRYAEVKEEDLGVYNPLKYEKGIRFQSSSNKQGSDETDDDMKTSEIMELMLRANKHQDEIYKLYKQMIEKGCAKEIARFWLPMSEYTLMYVQFDLNNLLKFLTLRDDSHAQHEIQVVARAMSAIAEQIFPNVFESYYESREGMFLNSNEIQAVMKAISEGTSPSFNGSSSDIVEFDNKIKRLGLKCGLASNEYKRPQVPKSYISAISLNTSNTSFSLCKVSIFIMGLYLIFKYST